METLRNVTAILNTFAFFANAIVFIIACREIRRAKKLIKEQREYLEAQRKMFGLDKPKLFCKNCAGNELRETAMIGTYVCDDCKTVYDQKGNFK